MPDFDPWDGKNPFITEETSVATLDAEDPWKGSNPFMPGENQPESSNPLVNLGKGLYKGTVYGIPEQLGKAAQFLGVGGQTAKDITKWGEEGIGKEEKGVFQQTGEMIPESIGVPIVSHVAGSALQAIPHPYAQAAGWALKIGGRFITPALFGLAQAQTTKETAEEAGKEPGFWPQVTGGIEWAGETAANIALGRILGPFATMGKVTKTAIAKMSVTGAMKGTIGAYLKELALVTAPTEILTEMGQNYGEALAEKWSGIRPEAQPGAEAVSAIAPTALMTALLGPFGRIAQRHVVNKQASILSEPINPQDPNAGELMAMRMKVAQEMTKVIPEENAELRDQWVAYASQKIQNNLPIDIAAPLDSLSMQIETQMDELPEEKQVVEPSEVTPPSVAPEEPLPLATPEIAQITPETAPAVASTETLPETRVETAPEEEIAPRPGDKTFIENKIRQLGTIEAVNKFYSGNDVVSDYARTMAPKILGEKIITPPIPEFVLINGEKWSTGSVLATGLLKNPELPLNTIPNSILNDARFTLASTLLKMSDSDPRAGLIDRLVTGIDEEIKNRSVIDVTGKEAIPSPPAEIVQPGAIWPKEMESGFAYSKVNNNVPRLDNAIALDARSKSWGNFLEDYGQLTHEVEGHKLYDTKPAGIQVIVGPDGSVMTGTPNIMEQGWTAVLNKEVKLKNGFWEDYKQPEIPPGATSRGKTDPLWYQGQRATKTGAFEDRTDAFFTKDPTEAEWYAGGLSINPEDRISGGRVIAVRQSELEKRLGRSVKGEEIISDVYPAAMKESIPVDSIIKTNIPALSEKTKLRNPITGAPLKAPEPVATAGGKQPWEMTRAEFESLSDESSLYHATKSENIGSIRDKGIVAQAPKEETAFYYDGETRTKTNPADRGIQGESVYTFKTVKQARDFAYDNNMMENHVILKVDAKKYSVIADPEYDIGESFVIKGNVSKGDAIDVSKYHENAIKQALSEGKPVPPEVLKDYPELKAPEPVATAGGKQPLTKANEVIEGKYVWQNTVESVPRGIVDLLEDAGRFFTEKFGKNELSESGRYGTNLLTRDTAPYATGGAGGAKFGVTNRGEGIHDTWAKTNGLDFVLDSADAWNVHNAYHEWLHSKMKGVNEETIQKTAVKATQDYFKQSPSVLSGGKQPVYKGISREGLQDAISSGYLEPQYERWPGEEPSHYFTTDLKAGKNYAKTTATGGEPGELLRIKSTKAKFESDPEGEKGSIRTYDKIPISDAEIFKNGEWSPVLKDYPELKAPEAGTSSELFIRAAKKSEIGNPTRSLSSIPDKEGYEKVFKPYGEQGRGFYYVPKDKGPGTAGMFEETKAGDIHPDDTWEGYGEALDNTVRQTWKTKLEGFVNELQRTLQENRDKQTSGDTSYIGGDEVSILRRLRDRRLFDEEVRGANQRNDRQRWQGVDISPAFADTPEFKLGERHFASLGYQTVPVMKLPWGMAVNPNTKIVFMGEMSGDSFAYFMSHETSHILSAQGNPSVLAIKDAIDLANPSIVEQRVGRDWDDDYTRDEFTASIVAGVVGNESMLKGDQTENLKSAREAVFSATQTEEGGTKYGSSYGFVRPHPPAFYSKLSQTIQNASFTKMPVPQLKAFLKGKQITDAEIENIVGGMQGTVTKQQVLDEIKVNSTDFKDVVLSQSKERDKGDFFAEQVPVMDDTHFSQYTEPGAVPGSYREMFVTVPSKLPNEAVLDIAYTKYSNVINSKVSEEEKKAAWVEWDNLRKLYENKYAWQDGHPQYSDIQNPIVRIRYNEREVEGKHILFVEEMQGPSEANQEKMPEHFRKRIYDIGVKRVLALSKEKGFDGVAWTTGEMQAARYDLSKHINRLDYYTRPDGNYDIEVRKIGEDDMLPVATNIPSSKLPDYVGKTIAEKIIKGEGDSRSQGWVGFRDLDLKVGGEGLKYLYDRTLPAMFKKYGKEGMGETIIGTPISSQWEVISTPGRQSIAGPFLSREEAQKYVGPGTEVRQIGGEMAVPFIPITDKTPESYTMYGDVGPTIPPSKPPSTTQPASWDSPSPTPMSNFIYTFIDRQIDLRNVVRAIKKVTGDIKDIINPDLRERLYAGTVAEKTKQYLEREFAPLIQEMIQRKVNITDFEHYLWNRTAEETNEYIASLGGDHLQDGGSGILTADAKKYLASLDPQTKSTYDKLAARTDKMLAINRDLVVSYVLESKDTVDKWTNAYKNYAPLFREDVESGIGTGEGFSVTGPVSRKRKGSVRPVVDILAHIAEQRERIIAQGEKNRISTALYGLAKENPNPTFWKLATPNVVERLSVETGEMVKVIDMSYLSRDNVVMSRQLDPKTKKIIQRGVEFTKNPSAERMAKALKNIDMDTLGKILGISAKVTRFIASMNTQYNPVFGVVNFVRDLQFSMLSLSSTPLAGKQKQIWSNTFPALRAIYTDLRSKNKAAVSNDPWVALWEDFREHGGPTGYRDLFRTTKDRAEAIKKEMTLAGPQKLSGKAVIPLYRAIKGWLSDYNTAMENAVRLAAYKTGIDSGMSKDQAAVLAKSLTVDFNRKGQIATQAGSLYAFFNANAQGSARMIETLMGPTGTKIIAGGITLGALQAMMLAAAGFGDDEPPEFVRERSLIIPIGGKSYVTIPMPLGFHILPNIGRITAEFALGGFRSPMKKMVDLTGVIVESFNPMGSSGLSIQTITPTIIDPFTALAENKDWTGKEIYRENFSPLNPTPGFTRTKDTATWFSKKLSWAFNRMSGGTEYKSGLFSPTADQIDYLFGQAAGGIGRETTKIQQSMQSLVGGEELPPYKIPLVGRFYGSSEGQSNEATKFYRNLKILNTHELEIKGRQKAREPIGDYLKENPEARYWAMANRFETNISKLTDRKRRMVEKDASKNAIRNMNNLIAAQMKKMNDMVAKAEGR